MKEYFKKDIILIMLTYVVLAASVGVFFPFNALYLMGTLDFSSSQLSMIDSIGQLAAMLFLPLAGIMSDKSGRPGLTLIALLSISGVLMYLYASETEFVFIAIYYISFLMLRRSVFPIVDALTLNICEHNDLNFGVFRSIYSCCFMIFAIGVGFLFKNEVTVDNTFIYISIFFNVMVIVLAFFLPRLKIKAHQKLNLKVDLKKLIKNNNFFIVSFAIALAMAGVSIVSMYNSTIIYELGGKVESIGLATIMQMGSEVIFAWFAFKLAKKHGHLKLIFISMIVLLIRWLVTGIFFVYEVYYFSIWIEGFTTIFILILGMDYIKNIVVPQLISTSITIYTSITLLIYAILVNVAGYLRDTYSTSIMFYFLAVVTLLAIIVLFVKRRSLSQN